jgi:hypothetical protein
MSILLVVLTIISGLIGGFISGRVFVVKTAMVDDTKQHAKVIEAEEFRLADKNGKLFGKFAISDDTKISSIEYSPSPALSLYSSDGKLTVDLGITKVLKPDIGVSLSSASLLLSSDSGHCVNLSTSSSESGLSFFGMMTPLKNHISISDSDSEGAKIGVYSSVDGGGGASVSVDKDDHGFIGVVGKKGEGVAIMNVDKKGGGYFSAFGKGGKGKAIMSADETGGFVGVSSKASGGIASMNVDEYGGKFGAFGKGSDKAGASMGINEYGNGAIGLWDKNGNKLK